MLYAITGHGHYHYLFDLCRCRNCEWLAESLDMMNLAGLQDAPCLAQHLLSP